MRGQGIGLGKNRQRDFGASKCSCPRCGYEEAHIKGIPCNTKQCPKCGTKLVGK